MKMESADLTKTYGFVVLHYMAYEMTVECVSTLLNKFDEYNIKIAVVDNSSPNGSGKRLQDKYCTEKKVDVLLNEENEGFARGNNLGYRFLVKNYNPDYIIVINNDVLIEQQDFLNLIDSVYRKNRFAVLGPDIFCPLSNTHQNPAHLKGFSLDDVNEINNRIGNFCKYPWFYYYKNKLVCFIKSKLRIRKRNTNNIDRTKTMENVVLHGACYIFSKDFIKVRENCFNPDTFLYMEEDILHYECSKAGLKMTYSPDLKINHFEDVSTNMVKKLGYQKFKWKNNEMKKSISILMKLMNK